MASLSYEALNRGYLVSGHSAGTSYDIDFDVSGYDISLESTSKQSKSINGRTETLFQKIERYIDFTATFITATDRDWFEEFMSSVAGNEAWTFDPTGTAASPGPLIYSNCRLDDAKVSFTRIGNQLEATNERFDVSFRVRVENVI